jgi:HEAT repeat protein/dihydrofolate reductase
MRLSLALAAFVALGVAALSWAQPPVEVKKTEAPVAVDPVKTSDTKIPAKPGITGDEKTLKDVGLPTDGPALLDYLRRQTAPEADPKQMEALVDDLGDDDFHVREAAAAKLIQLGKGAIIGLKAAEKDNDYEVKRRAVDLRKKLEAKVEPAIQSATVRLIAKKKPDHSADVLLSFLPFAADTSVADEVCKSLGTVAATANGVDPAVVAALNDKNALKRAAAGEAVARIKSSELLPRARQLLKDPEAIVRVRTGVALVNGRDSSAIPEAIPALIDSLKSLPPENLWAVEDLLVRLAGDGKVPATSLGTNEATREACYKAWQAWYDANKSDIALARLDQTDPMLGNTLVVYQSLNRNLINNGGIVRRAVSGEIVELDQNKKVLWKMPLDDAFPVEAQVIPDQPGEVVCAEYQRGRVTVRDIKTGKILWEKNSGGNPIGVQVIPGGKFLVTMQNRIIEVDRAKNEDRTVVNRANFHDIYRARRTKSGDLIYVTNGGRLFRLDSKGKLLKEFQVPQVPVLFGSIDVLPNGNVLIPDFQQQRVVEYDTNGNQVNQINTPWPNAAMRLPNGHTLVTSQNARRVSEINRAGAVVWSYDVDGQLFNARRR